jgi:hypothetical protein
VAGWIFAALLWTAALVGVGAPMLGADFGGAVAFSISYLAAAAALWSLASGKKIAVWQALVGVLIVALAAGGLVVFDALRPAGLRTHVGELAARAMAEGFGGVWEIALRKAELNVRMALSLYFIGGVLVATPVLWLWYHRLGPYAGDALAARPLLRVGIFSTLFGGAAVMLLNDTGVVAWAMATGCALFLWLDLMLSDAIHEG